LELYGKKEPHDAAFFDSKNSETTRRREKMAEDCLEELIKFLKYGGGNVGIHGKSFLVQNKIVQLELPCRCD
jgi:6-phosphofructo-2-kinase / fructose-2,6-biphosphatase 2